MVKAYVIHILPNMGVVKSDKVIVRKNSAGSDFIRRRLNLIEGSNVTLTVADDSANNEVDVTIAAASGGGNQRASFGTVFEKAERFTLTTVSTGSATFGVNGLVLSTGATGTSSQAARLEGGSFNGWDKYAHNTAVAIYCRVSTAPTTGSAYFGSNFQTVNGSGHTYNSRDGYGFKITYSGSTATLSATNSNGTTETATDITSGITVTSEHLYYAYYDSTNNQILFYVDGTLKATHTTNLPNEAATVNTPLGLSVSNDATATTFAMQFIFADTSLDVNA
jgi:hypothetical protein